MEVITSTTPANTASEYLNKTLQEYRTQSVLLMLSGGSALTILNHLDIALLGPHVTITTLDERFSIEPAENNFTQITSTPFYREAKDQGAQYISTEVQTNETLTEAGQRFNVALHHWRETHKDGVMIATMGVGNDGHTAGIFPHQKSLGPEITDWVVSYEIPSEVNPHTMRITTTPSFLKTQVSRAICLITGEAKRDVLQNIQSEECSLLNTPACVLKDMPSVTVVTDISQ